MTTPSSRRRSLVLAGLALYVPFVEMTGYLHLAVNCADCSTTAWQILPVGPGPRPAGMIRNAPGFPAPPEDVMIVAAAAPSLCLLAAVASLARRGGRWMFATPAIALACFSALGVAACHMIRM